MTQTLFTLATTGGHGEAIGSQSFLISDRGYAMDGGDALVVLLEAVNRWFVEAPYEEARAELDHGTEDYNYGDLFCSGRVLPGLEDYGIAVLDGEVPAGGPYKLADAIERHHEKLLESATLQRVLPEFFEDGLAGTGSTEE